MLGLAGFNIFYKLDVKRKSLVIQLGHFLRLPNDCRTLIVNSEGKIWSAATVAFEKVLLIAVYQSMGEVYFMVSLNPWMKKGMIIIHYILYFISY